MTKLKEADPGPWSVHRGFIYVEVHTDSGSEPEIVAKVHRTERGNVDANARLIAAAPELLAALQAIQTGPHGCSFCDSGKLRNPAKGHFDDCGFLMMEHAITKATGAAQ